MINFSAFFVVKQNHSGNLPYNPNNPGRVHGATNPHARKRCKELVFVCNGDHNGVSYCLGTGFGKHSWVNPVALKQLSIRASSRVGRNTIPKVL